MQRLVMAGLNHDQNMSDGNKRGFTPINRVESLQYS